MSKEYTPRKPQMEFFQEETFQNGIHDKQEFPVVFETAPLSKGLPNLLGPHNTTIPIESAQRRQICQVLENLSNWDGCGAGEASCSSGEDWVWKHQSRPHWCVSGEILRSVNWDIAEAASGLLVA